MQIGKKIYFDLLTGDVITDIGERQGAVIETTVEQDIMTYKALSERNRNTFDYIDLPYGAFQEQFALCQGYRVNPTTKDIEFDYEPAFNLEQYKIFKIDELSRKCQEDIHKGFTASNGHNYRTNSDDQLNFLGKFNQIISDPTITTVMWKTEDKGYISHTREEWVSLYNEALSAKEQKLFKYDQLKHQISSFTTKEQVEAVIW